MSKLAILDERVTGFEMEYSASVVTHEPNAKVEYAANQHVLVDDIRESYGSTKNGFLGNGFRVYEDCQMTEICTPETYPSNIGLLQLVSEDMAMSALFDLILHLDAEYPLDDTASRRPFLPLRVSDLMQSSGFHENYQSLQSDSERSATIETFLSHYSVALASFTGQGIAYLERTDSNTYKGTLAPAQKIGTPNAGSPSYVTFFEAAGGGRSRYELRRNNYPTAHWQLKHRAAYTSAVLRCAEMSLFPTYKYLFADEPERVSIMTMDDPHLRVPMLKGRRKLSLVEYQLELAEKVSELAVKHDFPDYEAAAAAEVARVCAALQARQYKEIALQVPWVMKLLKIQRSIPEFLGDDSSAHTYAKAAQICAAFDALGTGTALEKIRGKQGIYTGQDVTAAHGRDMPSLAVAKERGAAILNLSHQMRNACDGQWMDSTLIVN